MPPRPVTEIALLFFNILMIINDFRVDVVTFVVKARNTMEQLGHLECSSFRPAANSE
jgi:hypothetical protein